MYGLYREVAGIELPDVEIDLGVGEYPEDAFEEYVRSYSALWRPVDTAVEPLRIFDVAFFCTTMIAETTHVAVVCNEFDVVTAEAGDRARRVAIKTIEKLRSLRWIRYVGPGAEKLS